MKQLLVSHPHAAVFANAVAAGMAGRGTLWRYVTGVASAQGSLAGGLFDAAAARFPTARNRVLDGIGGHQLLSLAPLELAARLAGRTGHVSAYDAMFVAHDAAVAAIPWPQDLGGAYAFEDAALWTLKKARRRGVPSVYDLPIPHHRTLEGMWRREFSRWPGAVAGPVPLEPHWKQVRKDRELASADIVVVASAFTENSVREAGHTGSVVCNPYGFPGGLFAPRTHAPAGPFTALAVGSQDLRKGTPYLLDAWRKAGLRDARLRIIGRMALDPRFLAPFHGLYEHIPGIPRTQLPLEYAKADLLVFPTLGDGFGMVISEAMACGTPVLTTPCGGGPEVITPGTDGLIIPAGNVDALVECLRWAAGNRDALHRMGAAAAARAAGYTWEDAGARLAGAIQNVLPG